MEPTTMLVFIIQLSALVSPIAACKGGKALSPTGLYVAAHYAGALTEGRPDRLEAFKFRGDCLMALTTLFPMSRAGATSQIEGIA